MSLALDQKINVIYDRIGWNTLRSQLGGTIGVTAISRREFTDRAVNKSRQDVSIAKSVDDFWTNLIIGGSRFIRVYELENAEVKKVHDWLSSTSITNNAFTNKFPYPLDASQLESLELENNLMELIHFDAADNSTNRAGGLFCSKAYYTTSMELDSNYLSDDGKELLNNGGEIIMRKRHVTQCFNLIYCDLDTNQIWLAIDGSVLPRTEASPQFASLRRLVLEGSGVELDHAVNLMPAVDELYTRADGRITSMGFITPDGNTSNIKLKRSQDCLRQDVYHRGGEDAAKILAKFRLGKAWEIQTDAQKPNPVAIELPGRRAMLDNVDDRLIEVHTFNCLDFKDLSFLINKTLDTL